MSRAFCLCLPLTLTIAALTNPTSAKTPAFVYTSSGTCLASPEGFNANLQPVNSGIAWSTTFNAAGSADADGNVTEVGQSVDTASFGVGPRMHMPAANTYKDVFTVAISEGDGSVTFHANMLSGTFTAGPHAGVSFTLSGFELKKSISATGVDIYGSAESPVIQTVSFANGVKFKRICVLTVSKSVRQ